MSTAESERDELRSCIQKIATHVGASIGPGCSHEFYMLCETEVRLVVGELKAKLAEEEESFRHRSQLLCAEMKRAVKAETELENLRGVMCGLQMASDQNIQAWSYWEARFSALSEAWNTGDNTKCLEAMRLFVKANDSAPASAHLATTAELKRQLELAAVETLAEEHNTDDKEAENR